MRASRLVQLLLLLQRRGRTTASELATDLEVSVRTIYRDVEALSASGVPIYGESGPGGGIQLVGGYETRLTGLTGQEATALGLAGIPTAAAELGLGGVLVAAQSKVDAALPPELRTRTARLRERFLVDVPGWFRAPEAVPALAALAGALWDGRRVDIEYQRPSGTVRRRLDPLGLVLKGSTWYLVALARDPDGIRTFRVGRVVAATTLDEPADRPADFDLAAAGPTSAPRSSATCAATSSTPSSRPPSCGGSATPCPSRRRRGPSRAPARRAPTGAARSWSTASRWRWRTTSCCASAGPSRSPRRSSCRDALAATGRALARSHRGGPGSGRPTAAAGADAASG